MLSRVGAALKLGRRGLMLVLGGLAYVGAGSSNLLDPRERFSSPGIGTDTILQWLDSPIMALLWIMAGVVTLATGIFRDRRYFAKYDAVGFNAFLTPPLVWTLCYAWSYATAIATSDREGNPLGLTGFITYALISAFIMVVAGWPETTITSPPKDNEKGGVGVEPSVIVAVIALISSISGVVIANRYTARTARAAAETTAEIERKKLDAASWQEALTLWKDDVKQLRERIVEDDVRHENETSKLQARIDAMEEELRLASRDRAVDRVRIDSLVAWSRAAAAIMRDAGLTLPSPPPGVDESLPPGYLPPFKR